MLLIKQRSLLATFISLALALMGGGVFLFHRLTHQQASPDNNRFIGESFLFFSIIAAFMILFLGYRFIVRSKSIDDELTKLGEGSERNSYVPARAIRNLGQLGEKINRIMYSTTHLSDLRRKHIMAQSNIIEMLAQISDSIYFITNVQGQVRFISKGALEHFNIHSEERFDLHVSKLNSKFNFEAALTRLARREPSYSQEGLIAYAAFDDGNLPHYLLIVPEEQSFSDKLVSAFQARFK